MSHSIHKAIWRLAQSRCEMFTTLKQVMWIICQQQLPFNCSSVDRWSQPALCPIVFLLYQTQQVTLFQNTVFGHFNNIWFTEMVNWGSCLNKQTMDIGLEVWWRTWRGASSSPEGRSIAKRRVFVIIQTHPQNILILLLLLCIFYILKSEYFGLYWINSLNRSHGVVVNIPASYAGRLSFKLRPEDRLSWLRGSS